MKPANFSPEAIIDLKIQKLREKSIEAAKRRFNETFFTEACELIDYLASHNPKEGVVIAGEGDASIVAVLDFECETDDNNFEIIEFKCSDFHPLHTNIYELIGQVRVNRTENFASFMIGTVPSSFLDRDSLARGVYEFSPLDTNLQRDALELSCFYKLLDLVRAE